MKKFILMIAVAFTALTMNAQTQTNYAGSASFWDNWSVGVNGGVQTNLHDWNTPQGGIVNINLNKEISPLFGVTFEAGAGFNNNADWSSVTDGVSRHAVLSHPNGTVVEQLTAYADGRINLTNAFYGYTGQPRWFEVEGVVGVGYGHYYDNVPDHGGDALLSKVGLNFNIDLTKTHNWTIQVSPAVVWNVTPTGAFNVHYGVGQLTAGVVYHFKTSNGTRHMNKAVLYDQAEVDRLNARIAELEARKPEVVTNVVEKVVEKQVIGPDGIQKTFVATFPFGSSELTDNAKAELNKIGENSIVSIDTYASCEPKTNEQYNLGLTQQRLNVVKAYLENRGVKVADANFHGGDDNFGRVAVVKIK